MKVGVLEQKDDAFIRDVIKSLIDLQPEFIRIGELPVIGETAYRIIVDRVSYQDRYVREYLKIASLGGCYVINNPFSSEVNNKLVEMKVCENMGIPLPKTLMLPLMKDDEDDSEHIVQPDWSSIKDEFTFPAIIKPHDGFGWEHVYEVDSLRDAENVYDALKERHILMLQEKINYEEYYRAYCIGKKDVLFVKYEPSSQGLGKYVHACLEPIDNLIDQLRDWTISLNKKIDFDFNSVEWCVNKKGSPFIIDAFNEVPDMDKKIFPEEEYRWIIDRLSGLVREKFNGNEKNVMYISHS